MKKLSSKKLRNAYNALAEYRDENKDIVFDIPSLMKYCIENDVRTILKEQKLEDVHIDSIFRQLDLAVNFKINKRNNSIKLDLKYKDLNSFISDA